MLLGELLPAFLLSLGITLVLPRYSLAWLGGDAPGGRKIQERAMPLIGFLCLPVPVALFGRSELAFLLFLAAGLGLLDDLLGERLPWWLKLAAQGAISVLAVSLGAVSLDVTAEDAWARALWLVLCMNAWNLADNQDGAASFTALGALLPWLLLGPVTGMAATAGALLGFLPRNWPRARVYLGDGGSQVLGLLLGLYSLELQDKGAFLLGASLHVLVLLDLVQVVLVRLRERIPPWRGDRRHLAHRLASFLPETGVAPLLMLLQAALCLVLVSAQGNG